jgi:hypothetical protein
LGKKHFDNYTNPNRVQTRKKNDVIHAPDGFQKYVAEEFPDLAQKTYESVQHCATPPVRAYVQLRCLSEEIRKKVEQWS